MRKAISTILATALLLAGLWLCWLFFTPGGSGRLPIFLFLVGPFMAVLGGAWLWEDWRKA